MSPYCMTSIEATVVREALPRTGINFFGLVFNEFQTISYSSFKARSQEICIKLTEDYEERLQAVSEH